MNRTARHYGLPVEPRRPFFHRLLIVWAVSLPISLLSWLGHASGGSLYGFDVALVYAYAISTSVWLFTDVASLAVQNPVHRAFWPLTLGSGLRLLAGVLLGYALGTLVGDAYAGWSTWDLLAVNRPRFFGLAMFSLAVSAAFVAFFYQRTKAQALASQVTQSQLLLLQSQLQPHMLFNTLAHLRALIGQDAARAQTMLDHLDDYLRSTLKASHEPLHTLAEESARLQDYLSLMAIRMGPRLAFSLDVPPALASTPVPSFVLQPLVENAIRHGLEAVIGGGRIDVQARLDAGQLVLTVSDNGCGMSDLALACLATAAGQQASQSSTTATSWGLRHVRQRLQSLYGAHASLQLSALPTGGTCAVLRLPCTQEPLNT